MFSSFNADEADRRASVANKNAAAAIRETGVRLLPPRHSLPEVGITDEASTSERGTVLYDICQTICLPTLTTSSIILPPPSDERPTSTSPHQRPGVAVNVG
jgi:hypothetical protein